MLQSLGEKPESLYMIASHMKKSVEDVSSHYLAFVKVQSEEIENQRKLEAQKLDEMRLDVAAEEIRESHEKTTIISFLLQKPLSDVESYYQKKQQSAPIIGNEIVLVAPQAPTIINQGQWSQAENALLLEGMKKCPKKNGRIDWAGIASGFVKSRTARQAKDRGRSYIEKQKKNP